MITHKSKYLTQTKANSVGIQQDSAKYNQQFHYIFTQNLHFLTIPTYTLEFTPSYHYFPFFVVVHRFREKEVHYNSKTRLTGMYYQMNIYLQDTTPKHGKYLALNLLLFSIWGPFD